MFAGRGTHDPVDMEPPFRTVFDSDTLRIWGFDEPDDDPQDDPDNDDPDEDDDGNDDDGDEDDEDDDAGKQTKDKKKSKAPSLQEQLDAEKRARLKAERALAREKQAKDDAEADKDAAKDRDKYKSKAEKHEAYIRDQVLVWEINKQKKFNFIDPDDVIKALKKDEVHIDLEGDEPEVEGLELALKRIAKDKPHYLKKSKKDEEDEDEPGQPSGGKPGGKQETAEEQTRRLGSKYKIPGMFGAEARPV